MQISGSLFNFEVTLDNIYIYMYIIYILPDACFNPALSAGTCAGTVVTAQMCGAGGQLTVFAHDTDPCDVAAESDAVSWIPIVLVVCVCVFVCVRVCACVCVCECV